MPSIVMLPLRGCRKRNKARDKVDFPRPSQYNVVASENKSGEG
jgi:hypothetical protein